MPNNSLSYPKVCKRKDGKYFIDFKLDNKRYRLFSGNIIGSSLNPNTYPVKLRYSKTQELAKAVYDFIVTNKYSLAKNNTAVSNFDSIINQKLSQPLSLKYHNELKRISCLLRKELIKKGKIKSSFIDSLSLRYNNNTSYNTTRRHVNVLVNYLQQNNFDIDQSKLKTRKQQEILHRPIKDIASLLNRIKIFNENLHLCCLLTYGCLLRPHQEIRLLKWSSFSDDLKYINLSGGNVKSRRNRIVPVPLYIREILIKGDGKNNIFSNNQKPYNKSYFSVLWRRFKRLNLDVGTSVTIYSFRHSGAIDIFKRTGSITKLQKAMGHSSINVSLTYLRGLEVPELTEGDMPSIETI